MLQKILSNSDAKTDIYTRAPTHKIQSDGGVEARGAEPFSRKYSVSDIYWNWEYLHNIYYLLSQVPF